MRRRLGLQTIVVACLLAQARVDAASPAVDATAMAAQYCDDTWRALSAVAVPSTDPSVARTQKIIDRLGNALARGPWRVEVFSYPKLDWPVMALMGNRILISREFVAASDDAELGFILAHEMGHVVLGHMTQRFAALIADSGGTATTWKAAAHFAGRERSLYQQEEYEADKFGFALEAKAGFDAETGAYDALSHLQADPQHPSPADRIAALSLHGARR